MIGILEVDKSTGAFGYFQGPVRMDFAIVGKLAQTVFLEGATADPFETHAFQFFNMNERHSRRLSFYVQPVMAPLFCDHLASLVFSL
jgi:hypothetical protein